MGKFSFIQGGAEAQADGPTFNQQAAIAARRQTVRTAAKDRQRKGISNLGRQDWDSIHSLYEYTGSVRELAKRSGLHADDVKRLLDDGIPRLGLPGIKEYATNQAQVELELATQREQAKLTTNNKAVRKAATHRAITDAAAAQDLLSQAVTTGVIIGNYVEQLAKRLATGEMQLALPEQVTPGLLETLAKIADSNSRTMERAVKLVRLTKGKPTEQIEHRIAALLASCTTDELRSAAVGGGLPRRLVSRTSAEPMSDGGMDVGINSRDEVIDVDFVDGREPGWLREIAPAEGRSSEDEDASSP